MRRGVSVAVEAFADELRRLGAEPAPDEAAAFGRRAALLAAAERLWAAHLGPLLEGGQVQEILGVGTRQAVSDFARRRRLLALPSGDGRVRYPAWQFGPNGRPFPVMADVLGVFAAAEVDPHTVASWWVTPKPGLGNATPAEWLRRGRDEAAVLEEARRAADRLGR